MTETYFVALNSLTKGQYPMKWLIDHLKKLRVFQGDIDNHLLRASMVIIYFFFGYQKWFDYEAQALIPFFTHYWRNRTLKKRRAPKLAE